MRTQLLTHDPPPAGRFAAQVVAVEPRGVALDRTAFYPGGGHQLCDTGWLRRGELEIAVLGVVQANGLCFHAISPGFELAVGDLVEGEVDWSRRHYLSLLHSAQHLLSRIVFDRYRLHTVRVRMDLDGGELRFFGPLPAEARVVITEALAGHVQAALPIRREPAGATTWVSIGTLDRSRCGGTHVGSTAELASVYLLDVDGDRLRFDGGAPGQRRLRERIQEWSLIGRLCGRPDAPATAVAEILDRLDASQEELRRLRRERLRRWLQDGTRVQRRGPVRVAVIEDRQLSAKHIKQALRERGFQPAADLYLFRCRSGLLLYSFTGAPTADGWGRELLAVDPQLRGGGNRRCVDLALDGARPDELIERLLAALGPPQDR
jgi:Ser-tRNA(Ala) deacylase AlaX